MAHKTRHLSFRISEYDYDRARSLALRKWPGVSEDSELFRRIIETFCNDRDPGGKSAKIDEILAIVREMQDV